jgi:uncharacterized membrane protein
MRQDPPAALETAIVLELPIDSGFVLLRAFVPNNSQMPTVTSALQSADCASPL